jgi:hypothetical protein
MERFLKRHENRVIGTIAHLSICGRRGSRKKSALGKSQNEMELKKV